MTFLWQPAALLFLALPALALAYARMLKRHKRIARAWGTDEVKPSHRAALLFLAANIALIIGAMRPMFAAESITRERIVILAIDISGSMDMTDIPPSRIQVAKDAAVRFIERCDEDTIFGAVAFAGTAALVQAPTRDCGQVTGAVQRLVTDGGTAMGDAIITALAAISETNRGASIPAAIILLTDGNSNQGIGPIEAAVKAGEQGIGIFPIGIGTQHAELDQELDEKTLALVARLTHGEFQRAENGEELEHVLLQLDPRTIARTRQTEWTAGFAGLGLALMLASSYFSHRG